MTDLDPMQPCPDCGATYGHSPVCGIAYVDHLNRLPRLERLGLLRGRWYGIDLTAGNCGWFLHVAGWRQLVVLLAALFSCYLLGVWIR